jgi:hypothetical protein
MAREDRFGLPGAVLSQIQMRGTWGNHLERLAYFSRDLRLQLYFVRVLQENRGPDLKAPVLLRRLQGPEGPCSLRNSRSTTEVQGNHLQGLAYFSRDLGLQLYFVRV